MTQEFEVAFRGNAAIAITGVRVDCRRHDPSRQESFDITMTHRDGSEFIYKGAREAFFVPSPEAGPKPAAAPTPRISVGDVVTLNSGGPEMTVIKVRRAENVEVAECTYFPKQDYSMLTYYGTGHKEQVYKTFPVAALTKTVKAEVKSAQSPSIASDVYTGLSNLGLMGVGRRVFDIHL
jgi:uncharacterized protein YodC (DUF2158 family)